jgi:hypothetical protein
MRVKIGGEMVPIGALNQAFLTAGWGRGWPGPTNTGYRNAPGYPGSLTAHDGSPIISGRTYMFTQFDGAEVGTVLLAQNDCTFYGCLFKDDSVEGGLVKVYGNRHTFNFCSLEPPIDFVPGVPCPFEQSYQYGIVNSGPFNTFGNQLTVMNCDIWGFGNAIDVAGSTADAPNRFYHNWIHDAADDGADSHGGVAVYHTDGIGHTSAIGGESHAEIVHNTIESLGNTNGIAFQGPGPYTNFLIKQNLLGGFGFTTAVWSDQHGAGLATNTRFVDNVISTRLFPFFGVLYGVANDPGFPLEPTVQFWEAPGSRWARNRVYVPEGAAWGRPEDSGRFWVPMGGLDLSDYDFDSSLIASDTDYAGA